MRHAHSRRNHGKRRTAVSSGLVPFGVSPAAASARWPYEVGSAGRTVRVRLPWNSASPTAGHGWALSEYQRAVRQLTSFGVGATAAMQTQAGQILELMGLSTQRKVPLFRQAVVAAKSGNWLESSFKWMGFWLSALQLAQSNTSAVLEIHNRAWQSWMALFTSSRAGRR